MLSLHLPRNLDQFSAKLKGVDPAALLVLAVASGLLSVILLVFFFR